MIIEALQVNLDDEKGLRATKIRLHKLPELRKYGRAYLEQFLEAADFLA